MGENFLPYSRVALCNKVVTSHLLLLTHKFKIIKMK